MGVSSNVEVFLSEKHLNNDRMVRPTKEIQEDRHTSTKKEDRSESKQQLGQESRQEQQQREDPESINNNKVLLPSDSLGLTLEIPFYKETEKDKEDTIDEGGFKTPTYSEHKISTMLKSPPAPMKPKRTPSMKRKFCRPRIVVDQSQEIESLFLISCKVDPGSGGKNKKFKRFNLPR